MRQSLGVASVRALKNRWSGERQQVARVVVERLILGGSLEELDLDRVTGRLDLRGLWLARTRGLPGLPSDPLATVPTAEGVTWRDLDLSGSTFRIDLRNAALSNIAFDSAGWPD